MDAAVLDAVAFQSFPCKPIAIDGELQATTSAHNVLHFVIRAMEFC